MKLNEFIGTTESAVSNKIKIGGLARDLFNLFYFALIVYSSAPGGLPKCF
jgi:hypothetical protein